MQLDNVELKLFLADDGFCIDEDFLLESHYVKGKILWISDGTRERTSRGTCPI